jgi:acyl carrier protein
VEPAEVAATLSAHPAVGQVVVIAREDRPGDRRLVAYFTRRHPVVVDELRDFLRTALPEPMVPAAFVVLDELPLTASGKVDRQALPVPESVAEVAALDDHEPPRTATESAIAEIWAEILGLELVGVRDDFFALGGHSLLATQVIARIRSRLGANVPLQTLFLEPTVAALAAAADQQMASALGDEELDAILGELENLSDEDADSLLGGGTP